MLPNRKFAKQPKSFWAEVKLISMGLGYSSDETIKKHKIDKIVEYFKDKSLGTVHLVDSIGKTTKIGKLLVSYFKFRAESLENFAKPNLMDRDEAKKIFEKLQDSFKSTVSIPYNKQKGEKRHFAYLTGIINLLTEKNLRGLNFDSDPRQLIVITNNKRPLKILSRRVDGTYPSTTNPYALWEIKEYYGTKTFGSRVADGVYETLLDGHELEELKMAEKIDIKHYLIIDDYFTWWKLGKSYLCRIIDMLHEGYLDEVIFGKEALDRWPEIVKSWPKEFTKTTISDRERLLQA